MRRLLVTTASAVFAVLLASAMAQAAETSPSKSCRIGAWTNAFDPQHRVIPRAIDVCPADLAKPLYTREGALACMTDRNLQVALDSMRDNWRFVPGVGAPNTFDITPGTPVSAETFGCHIYHDGTPVSLQGKGYGVLQTDIGHIPREDVRN